jgi:hypothetical protein
MRDRGDLGLGQGRRVAGLHIGGAHAGIGPNRPGPSKEMKICRVVSGAAPALLRSSPRYLPCLRRDASHSSAPDATRVPRLDQSFPRTIILQIMSIASNRLRFSPAQPGLRACRRRGKRPLSRVGVDVVASAIRAGRPQDALSYTPRRFIGGSKPLQPT